MRSRLVGAVAVLFAAGALAGCGSSVSPRTAMQRWASAGDFSQGVGDLLRDGRAVDRAVLAHESVTSIRTACLELFQDANGENTDLLPTPDDQLTRLLSGTYDTYIHAAAECDEQPASASALRVVRTELERGFGDLVASVLREEAVAQKSLHVKGLP